MFTDLVALDLERRRQHPVLDSEALGRHYVAPDALDRREAGIHAGDRFAQGLDEFRLLAQLGSASYSIYLVHVLTIGAVWQILQRLGLSERLSPVVVFAILAAAATSAGLLISSYAEKPLLRVLRRRRGARPQLSMPSPSG